MVAFNQMWSDINDIVDHNEAPVCISKKSNVFLINKEDDIIFVTKDDFVDFWSKMFLNEEVSKKSIENEVKLLYVYDIVKSLPYVCEKEGVLFLQ